MNRPQTLRLTGAAHVMTGEGPLRGPCSSWSELDLRSQTDLVARRGEGGWRIVWIGDRRAADAPAADHQIDLGGRLLTPGLVDAHTHVVFAGDRSGEFGRRMAGASYAEIAEAGGGILTTVAQTRAASVERLVELAMVRLAEMRAFGVKVVEIKTGYGLEVGAESRMLSAIGALAQRLSGRMALVATAMPAHAVPPEFEGDPDGYVAHVREEILPALAASGVPCPFVDIFVEEGYFDVARAAAVWETGRRLGMRLKAHVDEFGNLGGVHWAIATGAVSVEHLLQTDDAGVRHLGLSDTVAVCLPLTSVYLREPFAPMRALVDAGALVAVATDCNPGSAMSTNLPLAMQLAMLGGRLSPQECLRATTRCGALALACPGGYDGRLRVGGPLVASLFELEHPDGLFYQLGAPPRASRALDDALLA